MWFLMPLHKKIHTEVTMLIDYLEEAINIPQRTMHLSILCSCFSLSFFGVAEQPQLVNNLLNQTVENK